VQLSIVMAMWGSCRVCSKLFMQYMMAGPYMALRCCSGPECGAFTTALCTLTKWSYTCMHGCIFTHVRIHTHAHRYTRTHMHTHTHTHRCTLIYTHICTDTCEHTCTHIHAHAHHTATGMLTQTLNIKLIKL